MFNLSCNVDMRVDKDKDNMMADNRAEDSQAEDNQTDNNKSESSEKSKPENNKAEDNKTIEQQIKEVSTVVNTGLTMQSIFNFDRIYCEQLLEIEGASTYYNMNLKLSFLTIIFSFAISAISFTIGLNVFGYSFVAIAAIASYWFIQTYNNVITEKEKLETLIAAHNVAKRKLYESYGLKYEEDNTNETENKS